MNDKFFVVLRNNLQGRLHFEDLKILREKMFPYTDFEEEFFFFFLERNKKYLGGGVLNFIKQNNYT